MELWQVAITTAIARTACELLILAWAIPTILWFSWRWADDLAGRITRHVFGGD
jgi:hypothetical protein